MKPQEMWAVVDGEGVEFIRYDKDTVINEARGHHQASWAYLEKECGYRIVKVQVTEQETTHEVK
jgi:hypothetical protein